MTHFIFLCTILLQVFSNTLSDHFNRIAIHLYKKLLRSIWHPCLAVYNIRSVLQIQLSLFVHANKIKTYNIMYILFKANIIMRLHIIHLFYLERQIIILHYFNVILIYVLSPCK